ncbi:MAG: hypothetical protein ACKV2T_04065 [Kofleriaceae bacterium]
MRRLLLSLLVLTACTKESEISDVPLAKAESVVRVDSIPAVSPTPPPAPVPPAPTRTAPSARVELTAVTLADDCGGATPSSAPKARSQEEMEAPSSRARGDSSSTTQRGARARRCEQTSMQLAITASAAMNMKVKSVKLYDDNGILVGTLTAARPTKWSTSAAKYETWNESLPANTTINVSYVLSQPSWTNVSDRWNKTFTLKAVVSVGGVDKTTQKDVTLTVSAPTSLPPNVRT